MILTHPEGMDPVLMGVNKVNSPPLGLRHKEADFEGVGRDT